MKLFCIVQSVERYAHRAGKFSRLFRQGLAQFLKHISKTQSWKRSQFLRKSHNPVMNKTSMGRKEKDMDDLVHEEANEEALDRNEEEDPDDKVHRVKRAGSSPTNDANTGMEDPDDMVHGLNEDDEGQN